MLVDDKRTGADPSRLRVWRYGLLFALAGAAVSVLQILGRRSVSGMATDLDRLLATNGLAWLPWILIFVGVRRLVRSPRFATRSLSRRLTLHAAVGSATAIAYLAFLTAFHAAMFPEVAAFADVSGYLRSVGRELGDSLGLGLALYASIAAPPAARPHPEPPSVPRLVVTTAGRRRLVDPERIHLITAAGVYARLHGRDRTVLVRRTLRQLEHTLRHLGFLRIHRSAIVRRSHVTEIRPLAHGDAMVVLRDGTEVRASRTFRSAIEALTAPAPAHDTAGPARNGDARARPHRH